MCGFVGYVGIRLPTPILEAGRDLLTHRGPDSAGLWEEIAGDFAVGLGFRRLRIIDLSPAADQPMRLGDLHLVFNGEIYNFRELRQELEGKGYSFRSTGDTEVLLAAFHEWGTEAIRRLEGMFAFAIWDRTQKRLVLARDRLGIKPLYYASHEGRFVFGSEPKALMAVGGIRPEVDETALAKFLTFLWVPDPDTLFERVSKLPPGHFAVIQDGQLRTEEYWDFRIDAEALPETDHAQALLESLRKAVHRQLVADVPLGVFLSGGVDSTLIARLAAEQSNRPVLAIATGFEERTRRNEVGQDDLPYARLAARSIPNLEYQEIILGSLTADLAETLIEYFDDPVADPAAIATYLISASAKPRATVMLSGVGSEELFGGYPRHRAVRAAARLSMLPRGVRERLASAGTRLPGARPGLGMAGLRHTRKFLSGLAQDEPYVGFCAHHDAVSLSRLLGRPISWTQVTATHVAHLGRVEGLPPLSRALYLDAKTYLPSLNLAYSDRGSMAASVEVRVPFLDESVVERAARIPDEMKVAGNVGKRILKRAAVGLVPEEILRRPKTGFGAPVRTWMRELSSEVIRDCLSDETVGRRGLVDASAVRAMRDQLVRGEQDQALQLWAVVILELWARRFMDRSVASVPARPCGP